MRQPICVSHEKHLYQVIFRAPPPRITNRNFYVDAKTDMDARELAKNYLAASSAHDDEVRDFARWKIVEVNLLTPAQS